MGGVSLETSVMVWYGEKTSCSNSWIAVFPPLFARAMLKYKQANKQKHRSFGQQGKSL